MIVASQLHFLTESDNVGRRFEIKVLVTPHFSSWTTTGLYFVDQQGASVLKRNERHLGLFCAKVKNVRNI